jgi:Flp pilus assembly protein TadG
VRAIAFSRNIAGTTAVEFAITAPVFFMVLFGIIESGRLMWTQLGLQHAVEMAARCASVNKTLCATANDIKNFAVQQTYGVSPPASTFTTSVPVNGCGNQVNASYTYQYVSTYFGTPSVTISAQSCFPS